MNILVTGGAGYIGSHTIVELYNAGHTAVVVDNLANSSAEAVRRVEKIVNAEIPFYECDCRDIEALLEIFSKHDIDAVMHFAGLKSVGESVREPLQYYSTNLTSTFALCEVMREKDVNRLIFSSSATVYGLPEELPLKESSRTGIGITNPYGQTKFMLEKILTDIADAEPEWSVTLLRYFNPVGAHESGTIGEDPQGTPNNLLPFVSQTAVGKYEKVMIYGNDYDTPDGTGVRDYIHVVDLAKGHVAALKNDTKGTTVYNLGSGKGTSVLEIIHAFEKAAGREIPYEITERRPGDVGACYADPAKANSELEWHAEKSIEDACRDSWKWQEQNPNGYAD